MKRQLMITVMMLGLLITASARLAQAQIIGLMKAEIPFSFYVEEKLLPAGEYFITEKEPGVMLIRSGDGKSSAFFLTNETQEKANPASSELIFNKYGERAFLSQIVGQGDRDAAELLQSKLEKRIRKDEEGMAKLSLLLR